MLPDLTPRIPMETQFEQSRGLRPPKTTGVMDPDPRADDFREPPLPADMLAHEREYLRQLQRAMLLVEGFAKLAGGNARLKAKR
jgi:hypothetical protein